MPNPEEEPPWLPDPPASFVGDDDEAWRGDLHPHVPPNFETPEWRMWRDRLDDEGGDTSTAAPDEEC